VTSAGEPRSRGGRRALLALWIAGASLALLEGVLQVGARLAQPDPVAVGAGDPDAIRVLALGDSWTAGAEAPPGQGYVDHLEDGLAELLAPRRVEVRNLGQSGANTAQVALAALDQLPVFEPHLVVLLAGVNNGTSFARVAEFDQRFGTGDGGPWYDALRTVKAVRLLLAGSRGAAWGTAMSTRAKEREWPARTVPVAPAFQSGPGNGYFHRRLELPLKTSQSEYADVAWELLYRAHERDLVPAQVLAVELTAAHGWDGEYGLSAPRANNFEEVLARYALLRFARERDDWRAVRRHGGALHGVRARTALSDAGAAEAALLAGNWALGVEYLEAAWQKAPGFPDLLDVASRVPPPARSIAVERILEGKPLARATPLDRARHIDGWRHPEDAAAHRRAWLASHPRDRGVRSELALWVLFHGGWTESDQLMGLEEDWDRQGLPAPTSPDPADWRYYLHRAGEAGGDERVAKALAWSLEAFPKDPGVLYAAARVHANTTHDCDAAVDLAREQYVVRGDPQQFVDAVGPCMPLGQAAAMLDRLVHHWKPLQGRGRWSNAYGTSRDPEVLFRRHLDALVDAAAKRGTTVLMLDYPNPRHEYEGFQQQFQQYAQQRGVPFLDLFGRFSDRFSAGEWDALMAPGGHCNADGYAVMAEEVIAALREDPELAAALRGDR